VKTIPAGKTQQVALTSDAQLTPPPGDVSSETAALSQNNLWGYLAHRENPESFAYVFIVIALVFVLMFQCVGAQNVYKFGLCGTYIVISAGMVDLNKHLMSDTVFPHSMALTTIHMATLWAGLFAMYCVRPHLFPSMSQAGRLKVFGVALTHIKYFAPLGIFFAIGLFGSNCAYKFSSVAFLQFLKETNIVLVFCLSAAVGLQTFSWAHVLVIVWILSGAFLAITGEVHFVLIGFVMQISSQLGECSKNVLGQWMMTTNGFQLDALTYVMSLAPMALCPLLTGTVVTELASSATRSILVSDFVACWPLLLGSALLAMSLNILAALVIKNCSAVVFVLTGMVKDILIVSTSSLAFGDIITRKQVVGFMIILSGIAAWSSIKFRPDWWALSAAADASKPIGNKEAGLQLDASKPIDNKEAGPQS